jgi:phenylalanine-4-hydroxylase
VAAVLEQYDITREQPRLYVTPSCKHLTQVLEEFAGSMCYRRGGAESLRTAVDAASMCTARFDSGVQVSGVFDEVLCDAVGNAIYLHTSGPTQIALRDREIPGHGVEQHPQGFGSPIGRLKDFSRCLSEYTVDELKLLGIVVDQAVTLEYLSGITVKGVLRQVRREGQRNLMLSFSDCLVTDLTRRILFDPSWGSYDLAVGSAIDSVYGGVADRETLQLYKTIPGTETIRVEHDARLMSGYAELDQLRKEKRACSQSDMAGSFDQLLADYPDEWLLRAEILSMADQQLTPRLLDELLQIGQRRDDLLAATKLACADNRVTPEALSA